MTVLLISCGLMIAEIQTGIVYAILAISYYTLIHMNPFVFDDFSSQQQSWDYLLKHVALIGTLLILSIRGKI